MANHECTCGNPAEIRQERRIINILGEEHTITETYCHCPQCGEEWVTPAQCKAATSQIDEIKRHIMGHLAPADIAALRHRHHLTQQQAARLFGGGEKAYQADNIRVGNTNLYSLPLYPHRVETLALKKEIKPLQQSGRGLHITVEKEQQLIWEMAL